VQSLAQTTRQEVSPERFPQQGNLLGQQGNCVDKELSTNRIDSSGKAIFGERYMSILEQLSLRDKVSIMTGGARGLGKAMAQSLAQAGSDIVIVDLDLDAAQQTADLLASEGRRTLALRVDVTDPADVDKMTDEILAKFGRIDVLFNNAGIAQWVNAEDMSLEDWRRIMSVNLDSVFIMSKAVGKLMIKQGIDCQHVLDVRRYCQHPAVPGGL
jgi:NAD(P)-dependent dehydrogenase (short-subunit alcohol dehydrogenase family)